jgi:hypothetical protein
MQGCGSGRRLSSLRMLVSSWRRISSVSAASLSRERLEEVRHVDLRSDVPSAVSSVSDRLPEDAPADFHTPSQTYAGASRGPLPGPGESSRRRGGSRDETTCRR